MFQRLRYAIHRFFFAQRHQKKKKKAIQDSYGKCPPCRIHVCYPETTSPSPPLHHQGSDAVLAAPAHEPVRCRDSLSRRPDTRLDPRPLQGAGLFFSLSHPAINTQSSQSLLSHRTKKKKKKTLILPQTPGLPLFRPSSRLRTCDRGEQRPKPRQPESQTRTNQPKPTSVRTNPPPSSSRLTFGGPWNPSLIRVLEDPEFKSPDFCFPSVLLVV